MDCYKPRIIYFDELTEGMKIKKDGRIFSVMRKDESEVILGPSTYHKYDTYNQGNRWNKEGFDKAKFKYYKEQEVKSYKE